MQHLIQQNPQRPHIHTIIILGLEQHFRRHVLIRPAKGGPFSFDVLRTPPKVTDLDVLIRIQKQVLWLYPMISTFKSRWMIFCWCRYRTPSSVCVKNLNASASVKQFLLFWWLKRLPRSAYSMIMKILSPSTRVSHNLMICGWSNSLCNLISRSTNFT